MSASEVKGIWFDSASRWVRRTHGLEALARVDARVSAEHRGILLDPVAFEWYPEAALGDLLAAVRAELTDGTADAFVRVMEDVTLDGVGRFFRLVLSLASPSFVLRKVPVLWGRMRRGAGGVQVEVERQRVVLRYREFPYFEDENYRLMTVGTLRGVCRAAGASAPSVEISRWTPDAMDVVVTPYVRPAGGVFVIV